MAATQALKFTRYHALGNDYLILDARRFPQALTADQVRSLCDRHTGFGADGILFGPLSSGLAEWAVRIYNPDGSQAEVSGNGLRIFSRYLWEQGLVSASRLSIETAGGIVSAQVLQDGALVRVEMGQVSFWSQDIPVTGRRREVINETIFVGQRQFRICAASLGNPHCIVLGEQPTPDLARQFGPLFERHAWFPQRINVQFVEILDHSNIRIEIWERGAGYTLASGSSSCAAAAAARRLGLCEPDIQVHMPGGVMEVSFSPTYQATLTGPVKRIGELSLDEGYWEES